jgi:S1-C subfamily serine protease
MKRSFRFLSAFSPVWCFSALLMLIGAVPVNAQALDLARIQRATVFIMQARGTGDDLIVTCVSSGTLVSRDGLILTNAHSTVPGRSCPGDTLIIALSVRLDEPPVPRFRAEIVQADVGLDLALLRITRQNDGRLIDRAALSLPFVELGDSESVRLDDTLVIVGYPGIADDPVSVERGTVSGFTAEPSGGDKSWIKTSASIRGTMSGGGAYNSAGQLVGIPTTAPVTPTSPESNCVVLQDTNGDGLVSASDRCVPIGSFINSLRPSNFAQVLLRSASLDLNIRLMTETAGAPSSSALPSFSRLFFSPAVNEAGMPTTVISSLPTGSTSLYLFFNYENMTPETVYELRVSTDGIPNPNFSLSPVRWSGGRRGVWYVGSSAQPYPNGLYDFTLFIDGVAAAAARLRVGGGTEPTPSFSDLVFGILDLRGSVLGNGYVLGTGNIASARFIFRNLVNGTPWTAIWYFEGVEFFRLPEGTTWNDGANGAKTISVQEPNGLLPGSYRLELYIQGRLSATSDFTLSGAQDGAFTRIFQDVHFALADNDESARVAPPLRQFSAGIKSLYAVFDWRQIAVGTPWTVVWSVDDGIFFRRTIPWSAPNDGAKFPMQLVSESGIPDGTYRLDMYIGPIQFASIEARVGIGQLPIDRFAQASGVEMRGRIRDADTGLGIPGAAFFLVSEQFSADDFLRDLDMAQVYAVSISDAAGNFSIDRPLQPAVPYSVVVLASGYLPVTADNVRVLPSDSPIDVTIYLQRDAG